MKRKRSESPSRPRKQRLTAEGDLSPPVLEPICPTTPKVSAKLDILKPPTLTPNKTIDKLVELKSNKTSNRGTYRFSKKKGSLQNGSRSTSPYHQVIYSLDFLHFIVKEDATEDMGGAIGRH